MLPQPQLRETGLSNSAFHSELASTYPFRHWTQRRGVLLEALYKMSEGFFFGPHHLIMQPFSTLRRRFTKRSFKEQIAFPSSSQAAMPILEHLGYPSEPQLERKRICPWAASTSCKESSPRHIPEGITVAAPAIPRAPPATPASSQPSTSAEPRMAILYLNIESCAVHWRLLQLPEQSCSGDGSHQSMPGADVSLSGSTSCHLKAAPSPFRSATSCRALHCTPPEPHSQPSESHPPEPEAPADPPTEEADPSAYSASYHHSSSHDYYNISINIFMYFFFLVEKKSQYFGTILGFLVLLVFCIVLE
ncbi:hypothetical protein CK203_011994 [Vitis vinifera]|uniref:Uncharacterized protein n=1 Tax=Vitis vinifera TaxID=29760 RepID=A0A438K0E2_VITVI|nr:hypothetical protein CK203_011994 [Vitis vinifera]